MVVQHNQLVKVVKRTFSNGKAALKEIQLLKAVKMRTLKRKRKPSLRISKFILSRSKSSLMHQRSLTGLKKCDRQPLNRSITRSSNRNRLKSKKNNLINSMKMTGD